MASATNYFTHFVTDTSFTPFILQTFLDGLYTLLFIQAFRKLYNKGSNKFYILALTALWITLISNWVLDFVIIHNGFVNNNGSATTIAIALSSGNQSFIPVLVASLIADAILVWRCSILWNRNRWILTWLVFLLIASGAFIVWRIASPNESLASPLATGISQLLSFLATVSTTLLISLRIITVTRHSPVRSSYRAIIEILVESAAMYSLLLLIQGIFDISNFIHPFFIDTTFGLFEGELTQYLNFILPPVTGIAPTLIAFRVVEEKSRPEADGTGPLSHLTFRRSQRNQRTGATSGILSTLRFGRDNRDGSVAISSVHHVQLDVEAQDSVKQPGAGVENENKLEKYDGIENV